VGKHCGSIIKTRSFKQGQLFSHDPSQMATSDVYMVDCRDIRGKVKDKVAKITRKMIVEV